MTGPDNLVPVQLRELRAKNEGGHRAMTERSMGSIDEELAQRKQRVERLESAPA